MWSAQHQIEKQNLRQASILQALKDKGVRTIRISFSGSGDSGDIDEVEYMDMNDLSSWQQGYQGPDHDDSYYNQIKDLFYEFVDTQACKHGDWVNNEGGYGSVEISTIDASYRIDYYQRTVSEYSHDGQSIYKEQEIKAPYSSMAQLPGMYQ